jgi:hypothetical protein
MNGYRCAKVAVIHLSSLEDDQIESPAGNCFAEMQGVELPAGIFQYSEQKQRMQTISKVMSCLIDLFVMVNGIRVVLMPPFCDEPEGYAIIAVGLFNTLITLYVVRVDDRSEA